ncbi:MAG: CoA-binding domain protein [Pseudonocardiales bacterium]|nr:CoA-binding domain protein [Pseudonocardiales bacterium]
MTALEISETPGNRSGHKLDRLLNPETIAIVGLSDRSPLGQFVSPTLASDARVTFVNPMHSSVLGRATVDSIHEVDTPIDAVLSLMSAERTTELAESLVGMDVGGFVAVASGFSELGPDGRERQARLARAAAEGEFPIIGPNGLGFINVPRRISLTIAGAHKRRPGGISVVSQSGAVLSGVAMSTWNYERCGLNLLVSAGNEVTTDLADYVDYLAADPGTKAIGLIIETIRRPAEFFAAISRAIEANKPVVALKLARYPRTQAMAAAHTAATVGEAWVYDVALRQAGVELAGDPEELVDRLAMFDQLDHRRWTRVEKLAVITMTGGFAALSYDLAVDEGVEVPELPAMTAWMNANLPGVTVPNPLDATGLGGHMWPEIVNMYSSSDDVDALLMIHPLADEDAGHSPASIELYAAAAAKVDKPAVVSNCTGMPGSWIGDYLGDSLTVARGLRAGVRGLGSLGRFVRFRERMLASGQPQPTATGEHFTLSQVLSAYGLRTLAPDEIAASTAVAHFGLDRAAELGPMLTLSLGRGRRRVARRSPVTAFDAQTLAQELLQLASDQGVQFAARWSNRDHLARLVEALGQVLLVHRPESERAAVDLTTT